MGKKNRVIAQKVKVKQQQHNKKPKAVKTNLKRLNERVRDKVDKVDKIFDNKGNPSNKHEENLQTKKQDDQRATSSMEKK